MLRTIGEVERGKKKLACPSLNQKKFIAVSVAEIHAEMYPNAVLPCPWGGFKSDKDNIYVVATLLYIPIRSTVSTLLQKGCLVMTDGTPLCKSTADTTALSPWMQTGY